MKRLLLLFATAAVSAAVAPAAWAATWVVDNDRADCPQADVTTIEAGVEAASAGDLVLVCPGTYVEHVTLEADDSGIAVKAKGPLGSVVVDGANVLMHGFDLNGANRVLIEGFVVQRFHDDIALRNANDNVIRGNETLLAWDHDGIVLFANSHRNVIEHNVAHDNLRPISCGISAGGGSSNNVIRHNTVFRNANVGILLGGGLLGPAGPGNVIEHNESFDNGEPVAGVSRGPGIFNANSPASVIRHNRVFSNNAHGIWVLGAVSNGVTVAHNLVKSNGSTNDDDGIRVQAAPSAVVEHNDSRLNRRDGVHTLGSANATVAHNVVDANGTPGTLTGSGISIDGGSTGAIVGNNVARDNLGAGIRLRMSSTNLVQNNQVKDNAEDGITIGQANTNVVERNQSNGNGRDGIRVGLLSAGNMLFGNTMFGNAEHDAHDENRPANVWEGNRCRTDFPSGTICEN